MGWVGQTLKAIVKNPGKSLVAAGAADGFLNDGDGLGSLLEKAGDKVKNLFSLSDIGDPSALFGSLAEKLGLPEDFDLTKFVSVDGTMAGFQAVKDSLTKGDFGSALGVGGGALFGLVAGNALGGLLGDGAGDIAGLLGLVIGAVLALNFIGNKNGPTPGAAKKPAPTETAEEKPKGPPFLQTEGESEEWSLPKPRLPLPSPDGQTPPSVHRAKPPCLAP